MNKKQISLLAAFAAAKVEYAIVAESPSTPTGMCARPMTWTSSSGRRRKTPRSFRCTVSLGVPLDGVEANDLLDEEENLRFGPEEDRVDILASIGEMPFEQVWRNRIETEVEGVPVPFISKADLIQNKLQVGRLRDLADAEELTLIPEEERSA